MSHQYKELPPDQMEDLLSTFLISSWSYSKVSCFARHEKCFEMQHIYGLYSRLSVSSIAGNAYHTALEYYFFNLKEYGTQLPLAELQASAYLYLDQVAANKWRLTETLPTIEQCMEKATKTVTALLDNFYREKALYEDDIAEILHVEIKGEAWLTINGVDIPLPCHFKIDLVIRLKSGGVVVIDHKTKTAFTPDDEAVLTIGVQAMTYVLAYEEMTGIVVTEVWFMENKSSQNKDKSAQLIRIPVKIDDNARRLYEALLYEPVKRMIAAVRDPDYIYLINESDNYVDKAEIYDFWCRTMLNEFTVDSFNIDESKKDLVAKRLKKVRDSGIIPINPTILRQFKNNATKFIPFDLSTTNMTPQEKIEHVLRMFGIKSRVAHTFEGYSSNTFLLEVEAGTKITNIRKYRLDIANGLDVENVRLSNELVVYNEKSYLSIDISKTRSKDLYFNPDDLEGFKIPLGKDNFDRTIIWDMDNQSTPHMLVCGATGSGKSVFLLSTIAFAKEAGVPQIIIFDPKNEFGHLAGPGVDVVKEIPDMEVAATRCVEEMNRRVDTGEDEKVLIIMDELPDAIMRARKGAQLKQYKNVVIGNYADGGPKYKRECVGEDPSLLDNVSMLLQKGRSAGIRCIVTAQRADTQIMSGNAKNNMPVQVCFRVQKVVDSQVVLDEAGAENLSGRGDGLIRSPEYRDTIRFQAYFKDRKNQLA